MTKNHPPKYGIDTIFDMQALSEFLLIDTSHNPKLTAFAFTDALL